MKEDVFVTISLDEPKAFVHDQLLDFALHDFPISLQQKYTIDSVAGKHRSIASHYRGDSLDSAPRQTSAF
jgi:hypothetical protein